MTKKKDVSPEEALEARDNTMDPRTRDGDDSEDSKAAGQTGTASASKKD